MDRITIAAFRKRLLRHSRALMRFVPRAHDSLSALGDGQRRELGNVHAALDRIERGQFGRCESCSQGVELERLERSPWEPRCAACDAPDLLSSIGAFS